MLARSLSRERVGDNRYSKKEGSPAVSANMYRNDLNRRRNQRVAAEKKVGELRKKESEKRVAAAKAKEAAARTSSASVAKTKIAEASRRESEANAAGKEAASWQAKVAAYSKEEADLSAKLSRAERTEQAAADQRQRRQDAAAEVMRKREQAEAEARLRDRLQATERELANQRARSDAAERELADQRARAAATEEQVDQALRDLRAPKPERLRLLLLGASGDGELRVAREQARIRVAVERALHRDLITFDTRPSATIEDLMDGISRFRPHVVHFSGHGNEHLIAFEQDVDAPHDQPALVSAEAFAQALSATDDPPRLVLLNSCDSAVQIDPLVIKVTPFAIGMTDEIEDGDAITYATQFYAAVANGQSILAAHDAGKAMLALSGLPSQDLPVLVCRQGFDPRSAVLVTPPK
jgi:hypothetical protein